MGPPLQVRHGMAGTVKKGSFKGWEAWGDRAFATERKDFKRGRWRFRAVIKDPDYASAVSSWRYLRAR